jgi:imidazolonepropionase-like amidohydrolase
MKTSRPALFLDRVTIWSPDMDEPREGASVLLRDGKIAEILGAGAPHGDAERIDCGDRWLLPGFVDSHIHLWGARSADPVHWVVDPRQLSNFRSIGDLGRTLSAGFTTVREAGGLLGPSLRDAVAEGEIVGPKIVPAHLGISRTGGHGDCHSLPLEWVKDQPYMATIADGVDEVRRAVRRVAREGGEWVKVWASGAIAMSERDSPEHLHFSMEELRTICSEAHAIGLKVGAHVEFPSAIKSCIEAGIDVVEHGFVLDEEAAKLMAEKNISMVATMALLHRYLRWEGPEITEEQVEKAQTLLPTVHASAKLAYESGVNIAVGSDSFAEPLTPYGQNAEEILALNAAGLPAQACLEALTINGARVVGQEDRIGSVTPGKVADLVLAGRTNPLTDLESLVGVDKISLVLRDGAPVAGTAYPRHVALDD